MNEEMHILLVSSKYLPEYSGSGYRAHHLYKRLTGKLPGMQLTVLTGSTTENCCDAYDHDGFRIVRISHKPYRDLSSNALLHRFQTMANFHSEFRQTRKYLARIPQQPDLIHIFGETYVSATVIDHAIRHRIPLLIEICNEVPSPFQYVPIIHRCFLSQKPDPALCHFICISENLKKMCLKNGIDESNIWCRPNPIDKERFTPVDREQKLQYRRTNSRFSEGDKLIVYIANYRPSKNHAFLLDVIRRLPDDYKLFMKGPLVETGPLGERNKNLYNSLQTRIEKENLGGRVQLDAGFCENVEDYYRMADVYAFPSITEGLGTPVLENIACGIPVVTNLIPDTTDLWIKNDENGYLSSLEPEEFADKITKAVCFPADKCRKEAESIIKLAGTEIIDEKYITLIHTYLHG